MLHQAVPALRLIARVVGALPVQQRKILEEAFAREIELFGYCF